MKKMDGIKTQPDPVRLCTTHYKPDGKPDFLATPMIVNGCKAWAYVKEGTVNSYIPADEADALFIDGNIQSVRLDF